MCPDDPQGARMKNLTSEHLLSDSMIKQYQAVKWGLTGCV